MIIDKQTLTRQEAADYLGFKKRLLDHWAYTGSQKIPYLRIGKLTRYLKQDLDKWLESKRVINDIRMDQSEKK
jgi:excisionase family DNA binding protein